jgi:outer membrane protein assembly factor BamB
MRRLTFVFVACITVALFAGADWLQFRGSGHNSVAETALPTSFDVKEKKNVAWQAELPGRGPSSPIVVKDRVIVTASDGARQDKLYVLAFDAKSGKEMWRRRFWATGRTLCHPESSIAAPSPASDGERIFAFYSSNDLACLDLDGNLLWYRGLAHDYPKAGNDVGMSSSPVVIDGNVVVQVENQGDSFAAGIDAETGEERWRIARKPSPNWSSPVSAKTGAGSLAILQDDERLLAVDAKSGEEVWSFKLPCSGVTSSSVADGKLYVPAKGVTALDITSTPTAPEILWESNKLAASGASPVFHKTGIYTVNSAGVLTVGDVETGDVRQQLRLKGPVWATPVIAGDHLYLLSFEGLAHIVKLGDGTPESKMEVVGTAEFGEKLQGTPAVVEGAMFVRTDKKLWRIGK